MQIFKLTILATLVILTLAMLLLSCRYTVPVDGTPAWSLNNRLAQEYINDCNTVNHSIGLTGCAFYAGAIGGNVTFPSFYGGDLSLVSYNCRNKKETAERDIDNVFQMTDLYTATNSQSCSFKTTRTVKEGDIIFDKTIIGRIFIKILPNNYLYKKLPMQVNGKMYDAVAWYQKKSDAPFMGNMPTITAYPSGQNGILQVFCGSSLVKEVKYEKAPFDFILEGNESCDYELATVNKDTNKIDLGTFILEVQGNTIDIAEPSVRIDRHNYLKVSFNDSSIVGVQIENTKCIPDNECKVLNTLSKYTIKAASSSGRFFYGIYDVKLSRFVEVN